MQCTMPSGDCHCGSTGISWPRRSSSCVAMDGSSDATPAHRGLDEHDEVVAGQLGLELDVDLFAFIVAQRPAHLVLRVAEAQRGVGGQVLGVSGAP